MLTGIYLPEQILTNNDLEARNIILLSGKKLLAERIKEKIGVERRHIADINETVAELGYKAAKDAINDKKDIDVIFVSTSHPTPFHVASALKNKLQLPNTTETIDFHAACSGSALMFAYLFENQEKYLNKNILIIAADKFSNTLIDMTTPDAMQLDPSLGQTIFGDGAAAINFTYGKDLIIHSAIKRSLPNLKGKKDLIQMGVGDNKFIEPCVINPVAPSQLTPEHPLGYFTQNGPAVFETVYSSVPNIIYETVTKANLKPQDIELVIIHPGSRRVVESITEKLKPDFRIYSDYKDANMSSVSLLYSLIKALQEGKINKGNKIVLCGFGAGSPDLYSATVVIELK